jgi:hypothetical protein
VHHRVGGRPSRRRHAAQTTAISSADTVVGPGAVTPLMKNSIRPAERAAAVGADEVHRPHEPASRPSLPNPVAWMILTSGDTLRSRAGEHGRRPDQVSIDRSRRRDEGMPELT